MNTVPPCRCANASCRGMLSPVLSSSRSFLTLISGNALRRRRMHSSSNSMPAPCKCRTWGRDASGLGRFLASSSSLSCSDRYSERSHRVPRNRERWPFVKFMLSLQRAAVDDSTAPTHRHASDRRIFEHPDRSCRRLHRPVRYDDPSLLRHVSPLGWDHIVLTGDYDRNSGAAHQRASPQPLSGEDSRLALPSPHYSFWTISAPPRRFPAIR